MVYDQVQRDKALQRALKWTKLFKKAHFDPICDAITAASEEDKRKFFDDACDNIPGLTTDEREWLWNYLSHCGALWDKTGVLEAAAGTPW